MDPVWLFLLSIAAIFLIGAWGEVTFQRTNIPDVIWLILAGIILGPVAGFVDRGDLAAIAPYFAPLTLVVVLFEGGSALRLSELSRAAPRSGLLALLTFSCSVGSLAVVSMAARAVGLMPESWTWTHGFMLGTILGGSSSIVIMPAMAQARLAPKIANLVNLESALTDAFCVVGTVALIDIIQGSAAGNPAVTLLRSFGIGLVIGAVAGLVWILFLRALRSAEHAYPVTLSALLILYVVIDNFGGSAALGILTIAVVLGNAPSLSRLIGLAEVVELYRHVRGFHRQMAFIIKSFFFVFIGAMLGPPWGSVLFGILIGGLLYATRIPATRVATLGGGFEPAERNMVGVSMPRGMAAGVLATLPAAKGVVGTETLPVLVFAAVFTSILIFAVGFPLIKRRLEPVPESMRGELPLPAGAARPSAQPPPPASAAGPAPYPPVPPSPGIPDLDPSDHEDR
jgi:NhaP-type Na+/H+ or K+/H+ antiporter